MQMKQLNALASVLMALGFIGLTPMPAIAGELPSSKASDARPWLKMNPTTFPASHKAVLEQFDRVAARDFRLTAAMRSRLAAMLATGEGEVVMVPDGIVLDWLTGRIAGKPGVYDTMRKQLGREDKALMFNLGDGVTFYWFTGVPGQSCNNIGVVVTTPQQTTHFKKKRVCRLVAKTSHTPGSASLMFLPGFVLPHCCPSCQTFVPGLLLQRHSAADESTSFITVCEDQSN